MLQASELILNPDGSVYHLNLLPEDIGDTIIVVGDQDRVQEVSKYFDSIELKKQKREFNTHTGRLGNHRISVISSGIGTDNVDILMNELDALVNIDLTSKEIKTHLKSLQIIRIGTSGSLQADIPLDSLLVSENGIGLDNLMNFYELPQNDVEKELTQQLQVALNLKFQPYCVSAAETLMQKHANQDFIKGNTLTCAGFYAPQGRELRLKPKYENLIQTLNQFDYQHFQLTNFEMETAAYYAFGRMLGHQMLSFNAIVANRITGEFSKNPHQAIEKLIQKVLENVR